MNRVIIEADPDTLEAVATLLRTFCDRGPSGQRSAMRHIANRFEDGARNGRILDVNWRPEDYVAG